MVNGAAGRPRVAVTGLQPAQLLAGIVGIVYLVAGIVGLARGGFGDFAGHDHATMLGFAVNPLHNIVNLVIGALGVLMAMRSGTARAYGWLVLIVFGLLFVWGLMLAGVVASNPASGLGNLLNLNAPDNWLHLVTAIVGLIIAVMPARRSVVATPQGPVVGPESTTEPVELERPRTHGFRGLFHSRRKEAPR
jgi:uncharacterized protein DUF4383